METFESLDNELEKNSFLDWEPVASGGGLGEERYEHDWVVLELARHICF